MTVGVQRSNTALVIIDPQNDFLTDKGANWDVLGSSATENHTVENIERLFKAAKTSGYAVLISPPGAKPLASGTGLPANLDVNLSHAGDLVACVLGIGVSVGIDVEPIDRVVDAADIARAQFAPEEQASGRDTVTFLRMWTLKEAVAKAAGLGLALELSAFACVTDPPRLLRTAPALGPAGTWRLESWQEASHVVAIAVRGAHDQTLRPRWVDLAAL